MTIHNKSIVYRPEIDGLRALAVLPVILFHAGFGLFSGGFVGVDIFFVISGFLITSILLREFEEGRFSIVGFYERRARRILPALFFVIACCLPVALIWMIPDDLKRLGQSLFAVMTFSSNFFFWKKTDYFSPGAEQQPLLHTWSLAVEEQYYVLFPLFLIFCWRFGKAKLFWVVAVVALSSLAFSEWAWRNQPIANFYLLPSRAWEMLAGSLLAFIPPVKSTSLRRGIIAEVLSLLGLCTILFSIFVYDGDVPFPSLYSLAPVVGAALLIAFSSRENFAGRLLSNKFFVGIGLVSYSAYLWHQPLISFQILILDSKNKFLSFSIVLASLILAYFTYKYIETPFRTKKIAGSRGSLFLTSSSAIALVALIGLGFHFSKGEVGLSYALEKEAMTQLGNDRWPYWENSACNERFPFKEKVGGWWFCMLKKDEKPNVFLLGNSHANDLYPALATTPAFESLNVLSAGTCNYLAEPQPDKKLGGNNPCASDAIVKQFAYTTSILEVDRPEFVFLNTSYPRNLSASEAKDFVRRAELRAEQIIGYGLKPIIVLPRPVLHEYHVKFCLNRPMVGRVKTCSVSQSEAMSYFSELSSEFKKLESSNKGIHFLSQENFFCDGSKCDFLRGGLPLIRDEKDEHLSSYGSKLFGLYIAAWAKNELPALVR
ncbi:acyltransferase family protein [Pseudomonas deceptionensis]|uniref:Peptidoglycan/LPS O-acetylase OafA/YrhL, contains acyltransferase and SGNH-hydrolase domains n=1 Tax=Pseudomonas deceptionensis TaxID=882211 RepID=A0A1H5MS04_PSEDM|nr:acyltransferase family protein [Pseudomonas deceptionensis]SEE91431.1 Peptidoglycan/LPS O-acetylase OafA/YrhL, contains acyltransferase and SGNH-hydrolase domains [Pseudomonas deceptionensis]